MVYLDQLSTLCRENRKYTFVTLDKQIYNKLPPSFQDLAATLHGYRLLRQRYTGDTFRLVEVLHGRETWTLEEWTRHQESEMRRLLLHAQALVPYYRETWVLAGIRAEQIHNLSDLRCLPLTAKAQVREKNHQFLNERLKRSSFLHEHTSGTTGSPLDLWWTRAVCRLWYAFHESRIRNWGNVRFGDSWAMIGGQLVVPVQRSQPPFWVWNDALHQLYMSSYHLKTDNIAAYLDAMKHRRVKYAYGYASSLFQLAQGALAIGRRLPLRVVFSNAEPLYPGYREVIQEAFQCPVRNTYSGAEIVCLASECEHGTFHISPDAGIVEILDENGDPCPPGVVGEIVATGLVNFDMPLIRYRTGDLGLVKQQPCRCGRQMPVLAALEGRKDDILYGRDGFPVGRLDPVFKTNLPLKLAQIVQTAEDEIVVRVVPDAGYGPGAENTISARIRDRMGNMRVSFEVVDDIPRGAGGKFSAVLNLVDKSRTRMFPTNQSL